MPNYLIAINISRLLPVQAHDREEAQRIAMREMVLRELDDPRRPDAVEIEFSLDITGSPPGSMAGDMQAGMVAGLIKSIAQTCFWCHETAHRHDWGPGWVRCPSCQRFAPSAAERQEIKNTTKEKS